ncbi:MAG: OsmC family protein [Frankiaceae bacterium]
MCAETSPIRIRHLTEDQFAVGIRGHELVVDQPAGSDPGVGPTPTELFVAGLGACIGFYAERYLRRHDLPLEGLAVSVDYEIGERPARVTSMNIRLALPAGVPAERVPALMAVASHCTVHNSLEHPPQITIKAETQADAVA